MAVQKNQRETPSRATTSQGPSTVNKDNQRKGSGSRRQGDAGNDVKPNSEKRRAVPSSTKSAQISNTNNAGNTAGPPSLNVDERLKLVRERREQQEKLLVSRELGWLEREERARRYYERQLEERKRRLLEQRVKEERRRTAVEEKRRQRLKEETERYESAVRKTLEKSQRAKQRLSQSSRGRKLNKNTAPRRLPLSPWEKSLVSRLLTPTCSYLARSKSAGCQSGKEVVHVCRRSVSCHSMNATTTTTTPHKPQHRSGTDNHRAAASPSPSKTNRPAINLAQIKVGQKIWITRPPQTPPADMRVRPATTPQSRTAAPSPERTHSKAVFRPPPPKQLELATVPEEDATLSSYTLSPSNARPMRTPASCYQEEMEQNLSVKPFLNIPEPQTAATYRTDENEQGSLHIAPSAPGAMSRPSAGTTDPEEASRLLAEKRRQARLQREREEEERLRREEIQRRGREELERRRSEERARQEAAAQHLVEERKRREEEERKLVEAERARKVMEEAALLQKQREELARQQEKAEQLKQEREKLFQKEEAARQERKKRLEEIMRRTRRTDPADKKSVQNGTSEKEPQPKENTQPVQNGTSEEMIKLPVGTKPSKLSLTGVEDMVPVVAFKERRSLRTLTGMEEIQTHQRAEVI